MGLPPACNELTIVLIGLTQPFDKLLFESAHSKNAVIANQSADWCGNPPVSGEMYRIAPKKWESPRFLVVIVTWFLSTGGLPRQCAHWLAMTAFFKRVLSNTN